MGRHTFYKAYIRFINLPPRNDTQIACPYAELCKRVKAWLYRNITNICIRLQ
jgi:hypothetical protein